MANQWFRFKQFMIRQDRCAMKVGTDAVILGAWTDVGETRKVLDIGTGTGLLALMLAQRSPDLLIDAIEIDPVAAGQATENVAASVFANRIRVRHIDFREFHPGPGDPYDLVICNPPYFNRSFKSTGTGRTLARHADTLNLEVLFTGATGVLSKTGKISIILPSDQVDAATEQAEQQGFNVGRILEIRPVPWKDPRRHCMEFTRKKTTPEIRALVIEEHGRHGYSESYLELTRDFYLDHLDRF